MVPVAVAVAGWDVRAATFVNGSWSIANAAVVQNSDAVVYVVTDAICVRVGSAVTSAHAKDVELVPVAVAVAGWDVRASTGKNCTRTATHPTFVQIGACAVVEVRIGIVVARSRIGAPEGQTAGEIARTVVLGGLSVVVARDQNGASQDFSVVTNAIGIGILGAIATACTQCIELIAITVARPCFNAGTATHPTFVEHQARTIIIEGF